jgi:hypothetical protein
MRCTVVPAIEILVGSEVLTAVAIKRSVYWDITPCSPVRASRRFGGTHVYFLGQRVSQESNQQVSLSALVKPQSEGSTFLRNVGELPE